MSQKPKKPKLFQALLPIMVIIGLLFTNILIWEDDAIAGPNQMALIFGAAVAGIISISLGVKYKRILSSMVNTIGDAMPSILILLFIGALSGTWMLSGVVPALIYYGLGILNPKIFLIAAVVISAIVSISTGSSWSTIATVGVALLGIGLALGYSAGLTAGAIISGAYFGDKLSPLSDTTNLAPAMAGTDLFTHIKYMLYTTVPSIVITLIIFGIISFFNTPEAAASGTNELKQIINENFNISPWLLLVPIFLIIIIVKKVPPIPSILAASVLGGIFAAIFQHDLIMKLADEGQSTIGAYYTVIVESFFKGTEFKTQNPIVDELLSSLGMKGMLNTIWLIITAMAFSGAMESAKMLVRIAESIIKYAKSTGSLVFSTVVTSIFMNITASEQYISIVVPGRMYAKTYRNKGLKPEVLSRTLEDGGTVTSVLVPWNTCGAVNSSVLGVATLSYLPFAFFNLISPVMTVLVAYLNINIRRYSKEELAEIQKEKNV
jgi:NhaC family Na+:H+ antiporter